MTNLTRRNFIGVAGIAAAGLGLVGCGGSGSSDTKTDDGKSDATTDKVGASEDLVKAAKDEGSLIVYGSCEEDYLAAACNHFQELYGIDVQYQRLSTGEVQAKIEEEKGNPSGDVWFGGTSDPYNVAAAEDLLMPYEAVNASHIKAPQYKDANNNWFGIYTGMLGIMYNKDELERKGLDAPKDCADLTDDYTDVTGYYSTHFPHHEGPPHVREATAHFMRGKKHYIITSGTTGYFPNPSEVACGDTWHGPFEIQGDPHVGDASHTSFHSQISSVFKVQGKRDLYIAVADRWLPDYMDVDYNICAKAFESAFGGGLDEKEREAVEKFKPLITSRLNTSRARYVWLPLRFDGERALIYWHDEWRWEDFE